MAQTDTPLGLYVHWPYCARICPYCDFNVYKSRGADDTLFEAILDDLRGWAHRTPNRQLVSLHLGGGTPSLMKADQIARLIDTAGDLFGFVEGAEIGLEANPNDHDRFFDYETAGINRLSLGVQSFQDKALTSLGRDHDGAAARAALEIARNTFASVSIDLIYAREGQSPPDWEKELNTALALGLDHLSLYQLTIEPGTAFAKRAERGDLVPPGETNAEQMYRITQALCAEAGLEAYEISNHGRKGHHSRHNRLYWEGGDWIGIGPGAHGRIGSHTSGGRVSSAAELRPSDYCQHVLTLGIGGSAETLSPLDEARERILMGIRISDGLKLSHLEALTGCNIDETQAAGFINEGWLVREGEQIRLTGDGRLLADGIANALCP
ncbi:radical SAM family heme chaperone HemW [Hyphobacterium sp.]|uniref:radical SAM family heme chaperone HemW n=1 Tax=Hyphobacterium sp. TaxID=2004662 RepID=UPI003BA90A20